MHEGNVEQEDVKVGVVVQSHGIPHKGTVMIKHQHT